MTQMRSRAVRLCSTYLHETTIPTLHFQDSLPKLPIPPLEDTLKRFVEAATPLVPAATLETTRDAVASFAASEGPVLHAELLKRDAATYSSFINEPWLRMYLESRDSLLLNFNPQLTLRDDPSAERAGDQAARAAALVSSAVRFYRTLRDDHLAPDVFFSQSMLLKRQVASSYDDIPLAARIVSMVPGRAAWHASFALGGYALDMSQYAHLFHSTRVPQRECDALRAFDAPAEGCYVAVQRGARFWKLPVTTAAGDAVPLVDIEAALRRIAAAPLGEGGAEERAIGLLTTMPRDEWAAARAALEGASAQARDALATVDGALFALCLDDDAPEDRNAMLRCLLHGDVQGSTAASSSNQQQQQQQQPVFNRWLDKSFQLIVTKDGTAAVNFEHAWGDGVSVLRFCTEMYHDSVRTAVPGEGERAAAASGAHSREEAIEWGDLGAASAQVDDALRAAATRASGAIASVEQVSLETDVVDSAWIKQQKLSPDGTLQMAMQLAHWTMHGSTASTYESASTAGFKHGRTETIRSATPASAAWTAAMTSSDASECLVQLSFSFCIASFFV